MKIVEYIKQLHNDFKAKVAKRLRAKEVVKVLSLAHAQELRETPIESWQLTIQKQKQQIAAVMAGNLDIIDRRSYSYPYLPECFTPDTDLLTKRGWVSVTDLKKSDEFATRSKKGFLEYQKATKLIKQRFKGEVLNFENKLVSLSVTPDHRMLGSFVRKSYYSTVSTKKVGAKKTEYLDHLDWWIDANSNIDPNVAYLEASEQDFWAAKEVEKYLRLYKGTGLSDYRFDIPATVDWRGKLPCEGYNKKTGKVKLKCNHKGLVWKRNQSPIEIDLIDYVAFLGIFAAEGHSGSCGLGSNRDGRKPYWKQAIQHEPKLKNGNYLVAVAQKKKSKYYKEIKNLLDRLNIGFVESKNGFSVSNATLHSHVSLLGNTYTKRIPQWLKDLPPSYLDVFLEWACKGDGWFDGKGNAKRRNYKTVSERLANDIQELFIKVGKDIYCKKQERKGKNKLGRFNNAPQYIISERHSSKKSLPKPIRSPFNGYVYCVSVPNTVVCARKRGSGLAVWCGNSLHRL